MQILRKAQQYVAVLSLFSCNHQDDITGNEKHVCPAATPAIAILDEALHQSAR